MRTVNTGGIRRTRSIGEVQSGKNPASENPAPSDMLDEIPPPPEFLKVQGQRYWQTYCSILKNRGMLSSDYLPALGNMCKIHDWIEQSDKAILATGGCFIASKYNNSVKANPLVRQRNELHAMLRGHLADFGLTPASARNANVKVTKGAGKKSVASRRFDSAAELFGSDN